MIRKIIEINEEIPDVGDVITFKSLEIEILEADDRKIDWVKITKVEKDAEEEEEE